VQEFSSLPPSPTSNFDLLMIAILTSVSCNILVFLICVFLTISDVEHFFILLKATLLRNLYSDTLPIF
jgi:hypothetical protein